MLLLQSLIRRCDQPARALNSGHAGGLAAQSLNVLVPVRLGPSRLRAPVSRRDCAISRRTIMNNPGWFDAMVARDWSVWLVRHP